MKKTLIILIALVYYLTLSSQIYSPILIDNKIVVSDGKVVITEDRQAWIDLMKASYAEINDHYSTGFAAWTDSVMDTIFAANYNAYDYYGNFKTETTADWLYLLRFDGNITTRPWTKTGDITVHNLGGTVTQQEDIPSHTYDGHQYYVASSTDGWNDLAVMQVRTNNFIGEIPKLNTTYDGGIIYFYSNSFTGIIPSHNIPRVRLIYHNLNNFTLQKAIVSSKIERIRSSDNANLTNIEDNLLGVLTTSLVEINLNTCGLLLPSVNGIFANANIYFSANTPTLDLTIYTSGGTSASPTGGASNTDIQSLTTIFTNAGYVFTAVIN